MLVSSLVWMTAVLSAALEEPAWPGFRGPIADSVRAADLPLTWSPTENISWRARLTGYGQSSPVVWGDQVYVTSVAGPNKETYHVTALDLASGNERWRRELQNPSPTENTGYVSKAAPTPVADREGIIVLSEGGNLIALAHEGRTRWERDLVKEFGPIAARHGLGSSLAQTDELAFIWIERQDDPYVLAVDKRTGQDRWKQAALGATAWSTPVVLNVGAKQQLVLSGSGVVRGFDAETGETLWTLEGISGNTTPSPTPAGDGLLVIGATVGRGEESSGRAAESNALVRIERSPEGGYSARFVWRARRATSSFGSPIVHRGLAYFVNASGVLFCLDAETGAEVYAERLPESVWATPLAVEDRIYFVGQNGTTTVVRAGPGFTRLAENQLGEGAEEPVQRRGGGGTTDRREAAVAASRQYAVAAVPETLLIRCGDVLYCIAIAEAR